MLTADGYLLTSAHVVEGATVTDQSGNEVELARLQPDGTYADPDAADAQAAAAVADDTAADDTAADDETAADETADEPRTDPTP